MFVNILLTVSELILDFNVKAHLLLFITEFFSLSNKVDTPTTQLLFSLSSMKYCDALMVEMGGVNLLLDDNFDPLVTTFLIAFTVCDAFMYPALLPDPPVTTSAVL